MDCRSGGFDVYRGVGKAHGEYHGKHRGLPGEDAEKSSPAKDDGSIRMVDVQIRSRFGKDESSRETSPHL